MSAGLKVWCDTCDGDGTIDETLGGEATSDQFAECPNCNGNGWWELKRPLADAAPRLLEALKQSAQGWENAIELGLLLPQHVDAAAVLRDSARAAIAKATQP